MGQVRARWRGTSTDASSVTSRLAPPLAAHFDFTVFAPVERLRPCQPQRAGKGPHHGEKSAVLKDFIGLGGPQIDEGRSEEHTSELQSLMRISYAVFCLKKKNIYTIHYDIIMI